MEMNRVIKINDNVKVVNQDHCYTTYLAWFKVYKMGKYIDCYVPAVNGYVGKVIAIKPHGAHDCFVYLVNTEYGVILMGKEGLKKIKKGDE